MTDADTPSTVLYPKAFHEAPPANFSGAFHWEYINEVLRPRRGIQLTDVDGMSEINGLFLHVETSNIDKEQDVGRRLQLRPSRTPARPRTSRDRQWMTSRAAL
jgi:hypothetical protein